MSRIIFSLYLLLALFIAISIPQLAVASGVERAPVQRVETDLDRAQKAINSREYGLAITYLNATLAKDERNADAYNLLGYSERMRGNLDAAFKHYERALAINPRHRGAHEYVGESYLLVGNLAKAEEQLAILDKLCFLPCEEYSELKAAVAAYKAKQGQRK